MGVITIIGTGWLEGELTLSGAQALRGGARVGEAAARTDFREIAAAGGVDHSFPVEGDGMRAFATLSNPENGLTLTCRSDAPGLLVQGVLL